MEGPTMSIQTVVFRTVGRDRHNDYSPVLRRDLYVSVLILKFVDKQFGSQDRFELFIFWKGS